MELEAANDPNLLLRQTCASLITYLQGMAAADTNGVASSGSSGTAAATPDLDSLSKQWLVCSSSLAYAQSSHIQIKAFRIRAPYSAVAITTTTCIPLSHVFRFVSIIIWCVRSDAARIGRGEGPGSSRSSECFVWLYSSQSAGDCVLLLVLAW